MQEIIRAAERASFKRCRRAWDFGSRSRQNYEPLIPAQPFDFERAIHDALALFYFPGMWEWPRAMVQRLALEGFAKSMAKQIEAYSAVAELSAGQEAAWEESLARGRQMLERYFRWSPAVDAFSPVRIDSDFDASIPDPAVAGADLVAPGGPLHYQDRIDALVVDAYDAYWIVDHRVVTGAWSDLNDLLLDEQGVAACWGWEIFYYGMKIAGTIYNELRVDAPEAAEEESSHTLAGQALAGRRRMYLQAASIPEDRVEVSGNEAFRRTRITRTAAELGRCGVQMAAEALEMTAVGLPVYPNPTASNCAGCPYREPCLAMNMGRDPLPVLHSHYRDRGPDEVEEGRLGGSSWSMNRGARPAKF